MARFFKFSLIAIAVLLIPENAQAQRRTPATDSAAIGGEVGLFFPRDHQFDSGIDLSGFYEYYMSPRTSLRLGLGWMNPQYDEDRDPDASVRNLRIGGDVVHNWEGGAIHPFAGAGLSVYILQQRNNGGNDGDAETKFGGNLFGGVELFTNRTTSVKGEVRYHVITDSRGFDPDGLALTIGLKKYF
jgi:hypothetical protein